MMQTKLEHAQATMSRNIEQKTGKAVTALAEEARGRATKHGEMVKYLQASYGLTHGYANFVALRALELGAPAATATTKGTLASTPVVGTSHNALAEALATQYAGPKAALRPIYEALAAAARGFGDDVEFAPKKTYVSLRRSKQFACIQPASATRVDVGLILKGVAAAGRLESSTDAMFTHRVRVANTMEVDAELLRFLKQAYDAA